MMQITLDLGLQVLGIEVTEKNYREICDVAFLAKERGVYLSPSALCYYPDRNSVYSPKSGGSCGISPTNLLDDVREIERDKRMGLNSSKRHSLDERSTRMLKKLEQEIGEKGIKALLISSK